MIRSKRAEILAAYALMAPFIVVYGVLFVYPTIRMFQLSVTNAPLIGEGAWVGFDNFRRLASERLFSVAVWNTIYFVILSVIPITLLSLLVALGVNRLKGWTQSVVLAAFFLPYILPVSVVTQVWQWILNKDFGDRPICPRAARWRPAGIGIRTVASFLPAVAFITVWWQLGFSVLLFIAGLRNISRDIYEAAEIDGAGRWAQFSRITWPLIWPITVLVFTIQLILELKIVDQVYLLVESRPRCNDRDGPVHLQAGLPAQSRRPGQRRHPPCFFFSSWRSQSCSINCFGRGARNDRPGRSRTLDPRVGGSRACVISILSVYSSRWQPLLAIFWAFPLYWGMMTTFKPESEVVRRGSISGRSISRSRTTFTSCSRPRSALVPQFARHLPGGHGPRRNHGGGRRLRHLPARLSRRRLFWWMILASFMIPIPALTVNHFILIEN